MPPSELLTIDERAARLRLKPSTIRAWIHKRKIPYCKIGGRVFIRRADIDALIERSLVPTAPTQQRPRKVTANRRVLVVATPISAEVLQ